MNFLKFTIPGKPMVQERPIVLRKGWAIDPPRSRKEKKRIALIATASRVAHKVEVLQGDLELTLHFYGLRPNADISNAVKLVEDALNKVAYLDDKQICKLTAERFRCSPEEGRTEVYLVERPGAGQMPLFSEAPDPQTP